jgi:hypothetical protein
MLENDEDRWLTYVEVGRLLGISPAAARMHAKRRGWQRRSPNAIGAHAMVLVPADVAVRPRAAAEQRTFTARMEHEPNGHDQANGQAIRAAIAALVDQLAIANRRIDELTEERRRDAEERRRLIAVLTDRRPWWRRWFR